MKWEKVGMRSHETVVGGVVRVMVWPNVDALWFVCVMDMQTRGWFVRDHPLGLGIDTPEKAKAAGLVMAHAYVGDRVRKYERALKTLAREKERAKTAVFADKKGGARARRR